jgi:hypothetical protein
MNPPKIEITEPRLFNLSGVLAVSAYGIFLVLPMLASILLVSVVRFGIMTVLIPFLGIALTSIFLPFGQGNPQIVRLLRSQAPVGSQSPDSYIVQLTLSPRIRSGFRALLEDADDIGYLTFTGSELVFAGDSVKLLLPRDCVTEVRPQNIGLRGLFVYGRRIRVNITGLPNVDSVEVAERSSWLLPTSRRLTRQLFARLSNR